ncbi:MAG: tRNA pseudouridine(38-40) synthase TruA [SAR324 cluster bacterium]|nr:tRNA pseudouridine(38-40) synthase TruA [SAR324 cluster bacterium]
MPLYSIWIEYDGSAYFGWQIQPNKPTPQQKIEQALAIIYRQEVPIRGTSRTDAKVHAKYQIATFSVPQKLTLEKLKRALNSLIPPDINIWRIKQCVDGFDARSQNTGKLYSYSIAHGKSLPAFNRNYIWHLNTNFNFDLMQKVADQLKGKHDFSAFRATSCRSLYTTRTIYQIELEFIEQRWGKLIKINVSGDSFLKYMVRVIVGTMVDIGRGRLEISCIDQAFKSKKRNLLGQTAPARGLCLEEIYF